MTQPFYFLNYTMYGGSEEIETKSMLGYQQKYPF